MSAERERLVAAVEEAERAEDYWWDGPAFENDSDSWRELADLTTAKDEAIAALAAYDRQQGGEG